MGLIGLVVAGIFLAAFVINVALGSVAGAPPLGVVAEMLLLFAAAIAFVAAILKREATRKRQNQEHR